MDQANTAYLLSFHHVYWPLPIVGLQMNFPSTYEVGWANYAYDIGPYQAYDGLPSLQYFIVYYLGRAHN